MEEYRERTNGSYTYLTEATVGFDWSGCDPEYGHIQSHELKDHLSGAIDSIVNNVLVDQRYLSL